MRNIEKINLNDETIHLKKSYDGWRVVYPLKNEDGSYNWFNIITGGSYWKLFTVLLIVAIILGVIWEYHTNLSYCAKVLSNINDISIGNLSTNINVNPMIKYNVTLP